MKKVALSIVVFACLSQNAAFSATPTKEICSALAKNNRNAILLNAKGDALEKEIALGEIESGPPDKAPDYIESERHYRLLVHPKNIILNEDCTSGICTSSTEIPAQCPNSREYLLTFKVNPRNFYPGQDETDIDIRLVDKTTGFPIDDNFSFGFLRKISATFHMPRIETKSNASSAKQIDDLFNGHGESAIIELTNTGDRPFQLGRWEFVESGEAADIIHISGCQTMILNAGEKCNLTLSKQRPAPISLKYLLWDNVSSSDGLNLRFYLKRNALGAIEHNVIRN